MTTNLRQPMRVAFKKKLFNKIFFILQAAFMNPAIRYIWAFGGSSASKTFSVVQLLIVEMMRDRRNTAMVFRKHSVDIADSIYKDFELIIQSWGLTPYFKLQEHYIECTLTGAFIRFRGMDSTEKIKGLAGIRRIVMEEVNEFDEEDLKQIRKRLRGSIGQQIVCMFNPISEDHWIKQKIFDVQKWLEVTPADAGTGMWVDPKGNLIDLSVSALHVNASGNTVRIKTNYLDNWWIVGKWKDGVQIGGFVDKHVIADMEFDRLNDPDLYEVYGLGNWGKIRTGAEFWKDFKRSTCTTDIGWCEDQIIFQSWDENVNPYLTCQIWQLYSHTRFHLIRDKLIHEGHEWALDKDYIAIQIDEICFEDPRNRVLDTCKEFNKRYPHERVAGLKVGGDRTSIKEDTKEEKGVNFYTKIMEYCAAHRPVLKIQSVNPNIVPSGGFVNECFARRGNIAILINRKCDKSIHDYQYAPEDSDGTIKKEKVKNKKTGVSYEKYGHPSDAIRYVITTNFGDEYTKYLKGGKKIKPTVGRNLSKNSY